MTPEDLAELIEDAAATAAYHRTRDQEGVPIGVVERLIARENPVRMWREHRGQSLRQLAKRAGVDSGYPHWHRGEDSGSTIERDSAVDALQMQQAAIRRLNC